MFAPKFWKIFVSKCKSVAIYIYKYQYHIYTSSCAKTDPDPFSIFSSFSKHPQVLQSCTGCHGHGNHVEAGGSMVVEPLEVDGHWWQCQGTDTY